MTLFTPPSSRQLRSATGWLFVAVLLFATAARSFSAVAPLFQNFQNTTNWPAIDAAVFDNRGVYQDIFTTFPADTTDTQIFLNHGDMSGEVGFRFDWVTATNRKCALAFTNYESGTIQGIDSPLSWFGIVDSAGNWVWTQSTTLASYCLVDATNIVNRGFMSCGNVGLLRMNGRDVNIQGGTLAAGDLADFNTNIFLSRFGVTTFFNQTTGRGFTDGVDHFIAPPHVYDLFWGAQSSKKFLSSSLAVSPITNLNFIFGGGFPAQSPSEQVRSRSTPNGGFFLGSTSIPLDATAALDAKAYVNPIPNNTGFDYYINVIFFRTNANDTNVTIDAEFSPSFTGINPAATNINATVGIVRFAVTNVYDVTTGQYVDNAFYLIDSGALENPIVMNTNVTSPNKYGRPSNFEITTATPFEWLSIDTNQAFFFNGQIFGQGLVPYDPSLIYNANAAGGALLQGKYESDSVSYTSGTYGAQVGRNPETIAGVTIATNNFFFGFNNFFLTLPDVSNDVPRIEINATNLDLTSGFVRSEGMLAMNAKHLVQGGLSGVDAGSLNGSLASTNGFLQIAGVVPSSFKRVRGDIFAWSGTWNNTATNSTQTNNIFLHVLIVDHELRANYQPTFQNLTLQGTNTVVQDNLRVVKNVVFDSEFLDFNSTVHLTEQAREFTRANAPHLKDFFIDTNGVFQVDDEAFIGWDVRNGINSFINHGLFAATAPLIKATYVQNTGLIMATNGGSMIVQADTVDLIVGPQPGNFTPTNTIFADRDIEIDANTVNVTNSTIVAGIEGSIGKLTLNVQSSLSDFVPNIPVTTDVINNHWQVNNGISVLTKPNGDLFGTEIVVIATNRNQSQIVWAGDDVGAGSDGFNNNLVVGHLVLDRQTSNSSIRISAAGGQNALYVDYLELRDFSLSDYRNGLIIDPNMTVYFASANTEPDKLQNVFAGRLVWANSVTGPNSTIAVQRVDGSTCFMNRSLAQSQIIDSDNDGVVNIKDAFPLDNIANPEFSLPCPGDTFTSSMRTFLTENHGTGPVTSLTVTVAGSGKVTPQQKSPVVQLGATYTLNAVPSPGNLFVGWSGSVDTTKPKITFTLASNMVLNARFVTNPFTTLKGAYNGLFVDTNKVTMDSAGSIALSVTPQGGFSGHLGMTAGAVAFGGQFDPDGNATVAVPRGRNTPFTLNLKLDTTGGSQQITGIISCGTNWTVPVVADHSIYGGRSVAPFKGNYTLALQGTNDTTVGPAGDSYGTAFVNSAGLVNTLIHLADNNVVQQTVTVSKDGNLPLFGAKFGKEMLIGWMHIDNNGVISGTVNWLKSPMTTGYYRAGFTNALPVNGSIWVAPKNHTTGLNLTSPAVTLTGGNLVADLAPATTFNSNNSTFSSTNPSLSLTLVPNVGTFNGHFTDPTTRSVRQFHGVMLQNQDYARGFFLGADQSGAVRLDNP